MEIDNQTKWVLGQIKYWLEKRELDKERVKNSKYKDFKNMWIESLKFDSDQIKFWNNYIDKYCLNNGGN